ncbi:MAG: hypothetical protein HY320_00110, partial [Armatimonadetes bacterium]|nr:hypothetical protein [Armatimonadota bacterium]
MSGRALQWLRAARQGCLVALTCLAVTPATAQRAARTAVPGIKADERPAHPPLPQGVPTTPENILLPTPNEVKLGWEGMAAVEKEYTLIREGPAAERLARVAAPVAAAVNDPRLTAEYHHIYNVPKPNDRSLRVPFQ